MQLILDAIRVNRPTDLVIHGLDYIDYRNLGVNRYSDLAESAKEFLSLVQQETNVPIKYAFTGKDNDSVIDLSELHEIQTQLKPPVLAVMGN